jgi:hypothetical protein
MAIQFDGKTVVIIGLILVVIYMLFFTPKGSTFVLEGAPIGGGDDDVPTKSVDVKNNTAQMKMTGNQVDNSMTDSEPPAALLPREVPVTEDFGQFSTDTILSGQNYLDPRSQIGYPETVGGTLRNSNLQVRSEPANPRDPVSIWNLSTISPEQMRPLFEIQDKEYS